MQQFEITLKNEKGELYNRLSWLIILILSTFFCYYALFSEIKSVRLNSIGVIILLLIFLGLKRYFSKTKFQFTFRPFFFILLMGWISIENYWVAGITFLFGFLSAMNNRKFKVFFSPAQIDYPSVPKKEIKWTELNAVVLKDNLLTIDFKSNRLIQQYLDENLNMVNEKEFNDFCRQQLNS